MAFPTAATLTWLEHAGENAASGAAAAALGAIGSASMGTISHLPWQAVLSSAAVGALCSLLTSIAALKVPNGTASFLPNVVDNRPT